MLLHLMELFVEESRTHRYKISKSLFRARMVESSFVQAHVLKMIEWIEREKPNLMSIHPHFNSLKDN